MLLSSFVLAATFSPVPLPDAPVVTASPPGGASADSLQEVKSGKQKREYLLHVPPGASGKPMPLVLVLHGHGGSAQSMRKSTGFNDKADAAGFVVAYLQGVTGEDTKRGWNTGISPNSGIVVDDVQFVRDVVADIDQDLSIDRRRVYAAGFSNGGMMSHRLAAELPDVLAAVGVAEGTVAIRPDGEKEFLEITQPLAPMPIVIMHGEKDKTIPYEGGSAGGPGKDAEVHPAAYSVGFWRRADSCKGKPSKTTSVGGKVIRKLWKKCAGDSEVLFVTATEGQHQWPTLQNAAKVSATDEMWKFFAQHQRPLKKNAS